MSSSALFTGLDTIVVRVRDIAISTDWYRDKLGFTEQYSYAPENLVVFDLGCTSLTLWQLKEGEEFSPQGMRSTYPIFNVGDAEEVRAILNERGVRTTNTYETGGVRIFYFYDPDGNCMEACQALHIT